MRLQLFAALAGRVAGLAQPSLRRELCCTALTGARIRSQLHRHLRDHAARRDRRTCCRSSRLTERSFASRSGSRSWPSARWWPTQRPARSSTSCRRQSRFWSGSASRDGLARPNRSAGVLAILLSSATWAEYSPCWKCCSVPVRCGSSPVAAGHDRTGAGGSACSVRPRGLRQMLIGPALSRLLAWTAAALAPGLFRRSPAAFRDRASDPISVGQELMVDPR